MANWYNIRTNEANMPIGDRSNILPQQWRTKGMSYGKPELQEDFLVKQSIQPVPVPASTVNCALAELAAETTALEKAICHLAEKLESVLGSPGPEANPGMERVKPSCQLVDKLDARVIDLARLHAYINDITARVQL